MTRPLPAPPSPDLEARLAHERNVWLCTLRPDGSPHLTPVWFVHADGVWWVSCEETSVKARNVAAAPRVSLALEGGDQPVVAEGAARLHHADFPPAVVAAFADKYAGWDIRQPVTPDSERVLLEIPVRRWLFAGRAR
ncbi:TIGR03618 family F420-dependent PPOX class oxidoreductase [Micromonospora sp. NPDC018662]|uniref:TIGR03618 family F420-dependent PPOX class oxidoreductase n=1 Tax=Micromonospora sp. NPDC018662 TaxID=3364238 RepID=UPI0037BA07A5